MEKRAIFPAIMFLAAGASFAFGIWQYVYAQKLQDSSSRRISFIVETVQNSGASTAAKQDIYAHLFNGLPSAPSMFSFDFSGSFASQTVNDRCTSDAQRAICRALKSDAADSSTSSAVCGVCSPN